MNIGEQKKYYEKKWGRTEVPNKYSIIRGEKIIEYLKSLSLINPKILDLGCGSGWFTEVLSNYGQVTGIDLSERAINRAKKKYPHAIFFAGDIFDITIPRNHYDVVISMEVIEHLTAQKRYIKKVACCLRSHGYLILSTPNRYVMERIDLTNWDLQPMENWLDIKSLKKILSPEFKLQARSSIIPIAFSKGIFRFINLQKIDRLFNIIIPQRFLDKIRGGASLGLNIVVLGQKAK